MAHGTEHLGAIPAGDSPRACNLRHHLYERQRPCRPRVFRTLLLPTLTRTCYRTTTCTAFTGRRSYSINRLVSISASHDPIPHLSPSPIPPPQPLSLPPRILHEENRVPIRQLLVPIRLRALPPPPPRHSLTTGLSSSRCLSHYSRHPPILTSRPLRRETHARHLDPRVITNLLLFHIAGFFGVWAARPSRSRYR